MVLAVSRVIRASGCYDCRLSVLKAITTISSIPSLPAHQLSRGLRCLESKQTRPFSSFSRHATHSPGIEKGKGSPSEENEDKDDDLNSESSYDAAVPWYLQAESPSKLPRPLSDRQRIPDLPKSPPRILEPLLQQISIELGLDDLSLLDLRNLDPPPALGANLLMVIGTARSEKHLHVSADRLCRWLRSEYKLRPDADGLLGRNELKLKIKRKNRRAKLLGSGLSNDNIDDGVRTGWVCVNIGTVESPTVPEGTRPQKEGFVGFGRQTEGVRIVVQMLVEEKREELDLEKLWNGIAKRSLADSELMEEVPVAVNGHSDPFRSNSIAFKPQDSISAHSSAAFSQKPTQCRGFHTSTRDFLPAVEPSSSTTPPSVTQIFSSYDQPSTTDSVSVHQQTISLLESGDHFAAFRLMSAHLSSVAEFNTDQWRQYFLPRFKISIENLPGQDAIELLGEGSEDKSSTPALRCFYHTISRYPSKSGWEFRIWFYSFAREHKCRGYGLEGLSKLFQDLQLSGVTISDTMYLDFLRTTLRPGIRRAAGNLTRSRNPQRDFAVQILQDMYDRTGNILTEDIFVTITESLEYHSILQEKRLLSTYDHPQAAVVTYNFPVSLHKPLDPRYRMRRLMSLLQVPVLKHENRKRLMTLYSYNHNWEEFWKLWRSIALNGEPRSPELWALMFYRVSRSGNLKGCMTVLRTWIPEMEREEPPVRLEGQLAANVLRCLSLIDPSMDKESLRDPETKGEFVNLWRQCLGIVLDEA